MADERPESVRPPWYRRAFELFMYEHFDSEAAAMLARSEWNERVARGARDDETRMISTSSRNA
jgi:hypothetical protein